MRRSSLWWSLLFVTVAATPASAQTSGHASLGLRAVAEGAPPPATVVILEDEPRTAVVPNSTVRVADDGRIRYDFFRYGVYWYIHDEGRWYRARAHSGPFRGIDVKYVPRAVITVPAKHWRNPQRSPSVAAMKELRDKNR